MVLGHVMRTFMNPTTVSVKTVNGTENLTFRVFVAEDQR